MNDWFAAITNPWGTPQEVVSLFNDNDVSKGLPGDVVVHPVLDEPEQEALAQKGLFCLV